MKDGFYFSYELDLTASKQKRLVFEEESSNLDGAKQPIDFIACDSKYFWNKNILQGFQENKVSVCWYTPII